MDILINLNFFKMMAIKFFKRIKCKDFQATLKFNVTLMAASFLLISKFIKKTSGLTLSETLVKIFQISM